MNNNGTRIGYGVLNDYRLAFNYFSNYWEGGAATIIPKKGEFVMGAIWLIDANKIQSLDK